MKLDDALANLVRQNVRPSIPDSVQETDAPETTDPFADLDDVMSSTLTEHETAESDADITSGSVSYGNQGMSLAYPRDTSGSGSFLKSSSGSADMYTSPTVAAKSSPIGTASTPAVPNIEAAPAPLAPRIPIDNLKIYRVMHFPYQAPDPSSGVAESYRMTRARMAAMNPNPPSILISSCKQGEGKTLTAVNLSLFAAKDRTRKICLVDMDLRKPGVASLLGIAPREHDILSVLRGRSAVEDALVYSEDDNLYVLPAFCQDEGGGGYLEGARATELLAWLHARFELTLIDTCPVLTTSDPAVLGPRVGGVGLVVRSGKIRGRILRQAATGLQEMNCRVLGAILND